MQSWAAIVLAAPLAAQAIVLGANGPLLAIAAAALDIATALALVAVLSGEPGFWRRAAPVLAMLAALLVWAIVPIVVIRTGGPTPMMAAVAALPAPDLLYPGLVRLLGGAAVLVAAGAVGYRRRLARTTIDWIIAFGALQLAIGLLLRQYDPQHVWGYSKTIDLWRYTGTMINANANATVAGTVAVLSFARCQTFLREPPPQTVGRGLARVGCLMTGFAAAGVCLLTGSRTMFLLLPPLVMALLLLDPMVRRWLASTRGKLLLALAAAAALALVAAFGDTTIARLPTLSGDSIDRVAIWNHYVGVAAGVPLFGYGGGAFTEMNAATLVDPADAVSFSYINSAHNELIEMVIERGWIGAALILATGIVLLWPIAARTRWGRNDPVIRAIPAALLVILAEGMIDIALDVPAIAALALALLGLLWGRSLRLAEEREVKALVVSRR